MHSGKEVSFHAVFLSESKIFIETLTSFVAQQVGCALQNQQGRLDSLKEKLAHNYRHGEATWFSVSLGLHNRQTYRSSGLQIGHGDQHVVGPADLDLALKHQWISHHLVNL